MSGVECGAATMFEALISMSPLTERVPLEDGYAYRHAAPDGVVPASPGTKNSRTRCPIRTGPFVVWLMEYII